MARVNVYLSEDLAVAVKAANIPISEVCQRALRAEVQRRADERNARRSILWANQPKDRRAG